MLPKNAWLKLDSFRDCWYINTSFSPGNWVSGGDWVWVAYLWLANISPSLIAIDTVHKHWYYQKHLNIPVIIAESKTLTTPDAGEDMEQ